MWKNTKQRLEGNRIMSLFRDKIAKSGKNKINIFEIL